MRQALGSNERRRSRRFYSPIFLFEAYAADLPLCASRRDLGRPPSAMRPWAPDFGAVKATDGDGKGHGRGRVRPLRDSEI
jgi:hypothetical protein